MTTDKTSSNLDTVLEEAQASLEDVSTTEKVETKAETKPKAKKETVKKEGKTETQEKEDIPPKERPKRKPPSYKTTEWALQSRKLFKISPEVMVIALREAGKKDNDMISIFEAKSIVQAFLKREVK